MTDRTNQPFIIFFAVAILLASQVVHAEGSSQRPTVGTAQNEIGILGVVPLANGSLDGITSDRPFFMFGVSYSRLIWRNHTCGIRWVSEIMPFELLREPFDPATNAQTIRRSASTKDQFTYGIGSNPVGADLVFLRSRRWQPYAGFHGGFSYFTRNVLSSQGAQFNFMIDGRAGLRFPLQGAQNLAIAYIFQHMSNAYTAPANPGVDSHMIQITYNFSFRSFQFRKAK